MFKSAQTLRLAADMRALQRVANPWREARTTWFDGTPESLEARLASTERVLTYARGGATAAHMGLEREASIARAELLAARHRLMVDFLDDGARAFKGSKRVAGDGPGTFNNPTADDMFARLDAERRYPEESRARANQGFLEEMAPEDRPGYGEGNGTECRHCGETINDYGNGYQHYDGVDMHTGDDLPYDAGHPAVPDDPDYDDAGNIRDASRRTASRRTADESTGFAWQSDNPLDDDDPYWQDEGFRADADAHSEWSKMHDRLHQIDGEDDPARYSARAALAVNAAAFVASQNTRDRDELAFRAARHIDAQTGTWSKSSAEQARAVFVAAVVREVPRRRRAAKTARRQAAVLSNFDDQLLFDS